MDEANERGSHRDWRRDNKSGRTILGPMGSSWCAMSALFMVLSFIVAALGHWPFAVLLSFSCFSYFVCTLLFSANRCVSPGAASVLSCARYKWRPALGVCRPFLSLRTADNKQLTGCSHLIRLFQWRILFLFHFAFKGKAASASRVANCVWWIKVLHHRRTKKNDIKAVFASVASEGRNELLNTWQMDAGIQRTKCAGPTLCSFHTKHWEIVSHLLSGWSSYKSPGCLLRSSLRQMYVTTKQIYLVSDHHLETSALSSSPSVVLA